MAEIVTGKLGVVGFDVQAEVLVQAVMPQEADYRFGVVVVLVFGGLHGLGLDIEGAFKALFAGIVPGRAEEFGKVILFPFQVRVEEAHVTFAAAPEGIARASQLYGGVDGRLYLGRGQGKHAEFGVGSRAVHKTGMGKEIRRSPEEFYAGGLLEFFCPGNQGKELLFAFRGRVSLGGHVPVVKAVKVRSQLGDKFKSGVHFMLCRFHRIPGVRDPGVGMGGRPEGICSIGTETMPVGNGKAQMVLHFFLADFLFRVVVLKR